MNRLEVIFEDNHLIAVNKPAGVLVHSDETGDTTMADMVKGYIKQRYGKPGDVFLGVIHRIDRPVSGVVIFARTSKALERMNKMFEQRQITKIYLAIAGEQPEPMQGKLIDYIVKDDVRNISKALDAPSNRNKDAKYAELDYDLIGVIGHNYLLEVRPKTGRPHQIRVQLAKRGLSIRSDVKYGGTPGNNPQSIALHCYGMAFEHPTLKKQVFIQANLPRNHQEWDLFSETLKSYRPMKNVPKDL